MKTTITRKACWLLPIRSILFISIFLILSLFSNKDVSEMSHWWSVIASVVNIFLLAFFFIFTKQNHTSFTKLINYQKGNTRMKTIVLITVVFLLLGMGGMYVAGYLFYGEFPYLAPMMIAPIPLCLAIINIFVLPITTALAEEGLYLGCGVNSIKSKYKAILIPAFFFALQHSFIPFLMDVNFILY